MKRPRTTREPPGGVGIDRFESLQRAGELGDTQEGQHRNGHRHRHRDRRHSVGNGTGEQVPGDVGAQLGEGAGLIVVGGQRDRGGIQT